MTTTEIIGQPIDRVDGRAKVTGAARYAAEFQAAGLVHGVAVSSTIAKGRIKSITAAGAPGVVAVLTHENMPRLKTLPKRDKNGLAGQTFCPLQSDQICYAGQYVAIVVAETFSQALHAAALVKVEYDEETPATWYPDQPIHDEKKPADIFGEKVDSLRGDPDSTLAKSPVVIRQSYLLAQENHNPMENSAAIALWRGDKLTLYTATQNMDGSRHLVATALGISEDNVKTICPFVGGAFGCKGSTWPHEYLTAAIAKLIGRPLKLELTRSQMFTGCGARPFICQDLVLAADNNGKLLAITHEVSNDTSVTDIWTEGCALPTRVLYSCENVRTSHRLVPVNYATPAQMRAPGEAPGTWALESAMDELAYAVHLDPLELRLLNYAETDQDEKKPFSSKALKQCYAQAADRFGWSKRSPAPGSMKDGRTLIGWGMATASYPAHQSKASVRVRLLNDGSALLTSATHDLGTGTYTIMTQIAADTLGLPIDQVKFELGNSAFPHAPVSGGSQTAASVGSAVRAACLKAKDALFDAAAEQTDSPLAGKKSTELQLQNGRVSLKSNPAAGMKAADILRAHGAPIDITLETGPSRESQEYASRSHGAHFVEVRIDPDLRTIKVSRVVSAFAAGTILNHRTAHSQVMGAIVMGIGAALLEQTVYDPRRAKIVNDNLADYLVPVNADIPAIDCFFVEEKDPYFNALGAKGVGELGLTGIAAAIANAIFHATGKRFRQWPIMLDQLL